MIPPSQAFPTGTAPSTNQESGRSCEYFEGAEQDVIFSGLNLTNLSKNVGDKMAEISKHMDEAEAQRTNKICLCSAFRAERCEVCCPTKGSSEEPASTSENSENKS